MDQKKNNSPMPKYYKVKFAIALLVLAIVFYGLQSGLFISWGIFDTNQDITPDIQLDALQLQNFGIDVNELEQGTTRLITNMNNAQQGIHFLLGMLSGFLFLQPTAGLTVGAIKEFYDFIQNYRLGDINKYYFLDALTDTTFWFLGGFVGFYILNTAFQTLRTNNIKSPRDLMTKLSKNVWRKIKR